MGSSNKAFWEDELNPSDPSSSRNGKREEKKERNKEMPPIPTHVSETDGNQMVKEVSFCFENIS